MDLAKWKINIPHMYADNVAQDQHTHLHSLIRSYTTQFNYIFFYYGIYSLAIFYHTNEIMYISNMI